MGIAKITIGTIKEVKVVPLNPNKAIMEIINPMNIEPVSPANNFAG